jgi:hypothetical protein
MTDLEKSQRAKAIATATEMITDKMGIIAGARILATLRFEVGVTEDDEDFLTFVVIDSETDDLPIDQQIREHWATEALQEKDVEVNRCENLYRQDAIQACKNIIKRWNSLV